MHDEDFFIKSMGIPCTYEFSRSNCNEIALFTEIFLI